MKINKILFVLSIFVSFVANAQMKKGISYSSFFDSYYWRGPVSVTGGLGLSAYTGDLCSEFSCSKIKPYFTLGVGYKLWPRVFVGGELDYFKLGAKDAFPARGYEFSSKNIEIAGYVNFYLIEDIIRRHNDVFKKHKLIKPYLYLGLSAMRYSVSVNANETTYPKYTVLVPVGGGLLFDITPRINVKAEAIYKFAFTDYLDGISKLANSTKNDVYGIMRLKVVYTPGAKRVKAKKMKISDEEKEQWSKAFSQDSNYVAPKKEAPDPEEQDPYYQDQEQKDQNTEGGDNQEGTKEDEETPQQENNSGSDW
jgi:hypothetical protein